MRRYMKSRKKMKVVIAAGPSEGGRKEGEGGGMKEDGKGKKDGCR